MFSYASSQGHIGAKFQYAHLLSTGFEGVGPDRKEAMVIVRKLAAQKYPPALYVMALDAISSKRFKEVFTLINAAAEGGNKEALYHLGCLYEQGLYTRADPKLALQAFQTAYDKGHKEASFKLSQCYLKDSQGMEDKAFHLQVEAATLGNSLTKNLIPGEPIAQHNVGQIYFDGSKLVEKDILFAIEYFKMAAEQDFTPSMLSLAMLYEGGSEPDIKKNIPLSRYNYEQVIKLEKSNQAFLFDAQQGLERIKKVYLSS
jgi:TPR repeat protein